MSTTMDLTLAEPQSGQITMALARALANSTWLPAGMRGNPSDVLIAMLTGRELGIGPMAALRLIYVVEGKPTLSGQLQLALLRRAGHEVREITATAEMVEFEGRWKGRGDPIRVSYSAEEAKAAGLSTKHNWKSYPADMLYWRCVSRLARRLDPTATGGMYAPADFDEQEQGVLTVVEEPVAEELVEGELPLTPADHRILIKCPRCLEEVGTQELREHMAQAHSEGEA